MAHLTVAQFSHILNIQNSFHWNCLQLILYSLPQHTISTHIFPVINKIHAVQDFDLFLNKPSIESYTRLMDVNLIFRDSHVLNVGST